MIWRTKKCAVLKHLAVYRKRFLWALVVLGVGGVAAVYSDAIFSGAKFIPPNSHVVGMPPPSPQLSLGSYSGKHPSVIGRAKETFTFPIKLGQVGPKQPLFAGPLQYPFLCGVRASGLGQPLVDNYQRWGVPVYKRDKHGQLSENIIGYSKDCSIPTQASYYYNRVGGEEFFPLSEADDDIATIEINGKTVDFIVRVEIGTINRFIYAVAALKGENETLVEPNASHWNKKLIYQFRGGVGIGFSQGKASPSVIFKRRYEQLAKGYAVAYSSGTQTSNHYNMWLSEDTALRVKKQFIALYGEPQYTVGVGGSGGAIQQFLLAQNNPDIIDAAIAEYSYPDMITQTTYAMDCELLEYYFDVQDRDNERWQNWSNRQLVEGLNAVDSKKSMFRWLQRISQLRLGQWPTWSDGESECVKGWRGLTPLVHNPRFSHESTKYDRVLAKSLQWSHWNDLKHLYGTDEKGYGLSTWDNVGVQYGLRALRNRDISVQEFLKLNASVGGWKPPEQMRQERFWFLNGDIFPVRISVWSHPNMHTGSLQNPAQRTRGSVAAMNAAYKSGHVFLGHLNIPVIGLRHYLDPELDMHHLSASLSVRKRLLNGQGHADNHLIWVTTKPHKGEVESFDVLDQWLLNQAAHPNRSLVENKPATAVDTCFNAEGEVIAQGASVWNGKWNQQSAGACTQIYQPYTVSRYEAGADIAGDTFKCHLQSVDQAVNAELYGGIDMSSHIEQLRAMFPEGVCDYSLGDVGRPKALLVGSRLLSKPVKKRKRIAIVKNQNVDSQESLESIEVSLYKDAEDPEQTDDAESL
jgi:Tannase-like family of unknown function (DUF6351)